MRVMCGKKEGKNKQTCKLLMINFTLFSYHNFFIFALLVYYEAAEVRFS